MAPPSMHAHLRSMPRWRTLAIATTASLMMALGSPPQGHHVLIWLGFIPLLVVLRVSEPGRLRPAFVTGVFGGLCTGLFGFPWIAELIVRFGELPWIVAVVGLLLFSLWMAIPFGLWAMGVLAGPQRGWLRFAWPVALWIALADLWPNLFPYTPLIGFAEVPAWIQAAEYAGVPALSAQVLAVGLLGADAVLGPPGQPRPTWRYRLGRVGMAVAIPALSAVFGTWRLAAIDAELARARSVRVGIIQPNNALMDPEARPRVRGLQRMSTAAQAEGAQLVVWPEAGAFPYSIRRPFEHDAARRHRRILDGYALPTIFGAGTYAQDEAWERNSVYNLAADGRVLGRFDKVILVPIGEYVPVIDPMWLRERVSAVSHNIPGDGPVRFAIDPAPTPEAPTPGPTLHAGPLVCYEDIFPDFARQVAAQPGGIELFINVTIDTWFGETAEPWQHLALAQLRSVEHRIPMVRSVAAGVSASIDAGGRLVAHLPVTGPTLQTPVAPQRLVTDVALPRNTEETPTLYARAGWLVPWLCQAWAGWWLGLAVLARLRRKPYKRPDAGAAEAVSPASDGNRP